MCHVMPAALTVQGQAGQQGRGGQKERKKERKGELRPTPFFFLRLSFGWPHGVLLTTYLIDTLSLSVAVAVAAAAVFSRLVKASLNRIR